MLPASRKSAASERQENVLVVPHAAVGDDGDRSSTACSFVHRLELRHSGCGFQPRAAAAPRTDTHLDRGAPSPRRNSAPWRSLRCRRRAPGRRALPERTHRSLHRLGMAVPISTTSASAPAHGAPRPAPEIPRAPTPPPRGAFPWDPGRIRTLARQHDVALRDEPADSPRFVPRAAVLDAVLEEDALGFLEAHTGGRVTRRS